MLSVDGLKGALQVCHVIVLEFLDGCSRQGAAVLDWVAHALHECSKSMVNLAFCFLATFVRARLLGEDTPLSADSKTAPHRTQ